MYRRRRYRRGPYAIAHPSPVPALIRRVVVLLVLIMAVFFGGRWIMRAMGIGNQIQRAAVTLDVEGRSTVNVAIEGGLMQRAEDNLKLYPGDKVVTAHNSHATLLYFDGTRVRLDAQTEVTVTESARGTRTSDIGVAVAEGTVWIKSGAPAQDGDTDYTVQSGPLELALTSNTEIITTPSLVMVFDADGDGITASVNGSTITVAEGQQLALPADANGAGDLEQYRSAIDPLSLATAFIEESRGVAIAGSGTVLAPDRKDVLTITEPADDAVVNGSTVTVAGSVGTLVTAVRINGYDVSVEEDGAFRRELSLDGQEETDITIEALDENGLVLAKTVRAVSRGERTVVTADMPAITEPAATGQTYRTAASEIILRGTAPATAEGIVVNDYRLQLFTKEKGTWSYIASTALGNMQAGDNVYRVSALDAEGNRSDPAIITIVYDPSAPSSGTVSSASPSVPAVNEDDLPQNDPLSPGTLRVTGPSAGSSHSTTDEEILLEGTTAAATASVWVNGYRLQLFEAGGTYWNYIANTDFGNLEPGENTYRIVARDTENRILDTFVYTVTYNP